MKIIPLLLVVFFLHLSLGSFSQEYFQQEVNYTISVKLDDAKHELSGNESIEYINNSPDELSFIYMHLWPNAYKNNETAMARQDLANGDTEFYFAEEKDRGFIDMLDFKVDGRAVKWEYDPEHIDICKLILDQPLKSGETVTITTPFHVKIPLGVFSRLGHMGQSYQITQWYPKPAVYDRNGWHPMPYLTQGEFYSEFGSYDVSITLPKNYVVGATGDLTGGDDEIEWLNTLVEKTERIIEFTDDLAFPKSSTELKTLRFRQSRVHDFAWFADKRYHVLRGEIELPHSKRKVTTWAMFTNAEAHLWKNSIQYLNDAIYYYSLWNGDYPFNHMTAVDGALSAGGGMEYPNITVIGTSRTPFLLDLVIAHEVGHNWFYGILASNERDHPWLDEGINSFNESRYIKTKYPHSNMLGVERLDKVLKVVDLDQYHYDILGYAGYLTQARRNLDQPIEFKSEDYTYLNYGAIVYMKTALALTYLMAYLGEETMDKAMKKYFETWKFRHPQPEDFRKVMEEETGKNLDWFFDGLINSTKKLDYKLVAYRESECPTGWTGNCQEVTVRNTGEINGPFSISAINADTVTSSTWFEGFSGKNTVNVHFMEFDKLKIDGDFNIPEMRRKNNTIKAKGLLRKTEPLKLQLFGSMENPDRTQLFFSPVIGWNNYNRTMLGFAFYNSLLPQKKFEYVLAPMYGFGTGTPVGLAGLNYHLFPSGNAVQRITVGVNSYRFEYIHNDIATKTFTRITPRVRIDLKKGYARSSKNHSFLLRSINIQDISEPNCDDCKSEHEAPYYNELQYIFSDSRTLNPYGLTLTLQQGDGLFNASAEARYRVSYQKNNKSFDLRIFAGKWLINETDNPRYNWRMDGQSGFYDYTYDHFYLARAETNPAFFLSRQFNDNHGAFKVPTSVAQSNDFIASMNLKSDLPIPIPIGAFADFGINGNSVFAYDAGLHIPVAKDIFEIYFPLLYSDDIKTEQETNNIRFGERIRFILNLKLLDPFNFVRNFEP